MKHLKRTAALVLAMVLSVMAFAGCDVKMENNDTDTVAAVFENEKIYMNEAKLYTYLSQRQMEYSSQFMILYYYGGYDKFWEGNWGYNLTQAMQEVYQTKLMARLAKDEGITLSESEKEELALRTEKMKTETETAKAIELSGATEELVGKYMEENAYATKYYLKLMEDVDRTFDQEEFRRKSLTGVSITAKSTKEAPTEAEAEDESEAEAEDETEAEAEDESETEAEAENEAEAEAPSEAEAEGGDDGAEPVEGEPEDETEGETESETEPETETFSDEEKAENVQTAMEKILQLMKDGNTASDIVGMFSGDTTVNVSTLSTVEVSPENAKPEDQEDFTEYKQLAWSMKTGDTESRIFKNDSGSDVGYVLHCGNDDDPDLRKTAEDEELEKRKSALFAEKIVALQKKYPTFHVYTEKVSNIKYKSSILGSITVTGDDFAEHQDELTDPAEEEDTTKE